MKADSRYAIQLFLFDMELSQLAFDDISDVRCLTIAQLRNIFEEVSK